MGKSLGAVTHYGAEKTRDRIEGNGFLLSSYIHINGIYYPINVKNCHIIRPSLALPLICLCHPNGIFGVGDDGVYTGECL